MAWALWDGAFNTSGSSLIHLTYKGDTVQTEERKENPLPSAFHYFLSSHSALEDLS